MKGPKVRASSYTRPRLGSPLASRIGSVPATCVTNPRDEVINGDGAAATREHHTRKWRRDPEASVRRVAETVSALALGGYHLGYIGTQREAIRIVHAAIDAGITFMDNAWEYHEGESEERMGKALVGRRDQVFLMSKVCTHGRDRTVAMRQLAQTLRRLKTDHLICGRCTSACTLTIPLATSRRAASSKRSSRRKNGDSFATSDSPVTSRRTFTSR